MKLTNKIKYTCGALVLGLGSASSVQATVSGQAFLDMSFFTITNSAGAIITNGVDVTGLTSTNSSGLTVSLNGVQAPGSPFTDPNINSDSPPLCIGSGCNPLLPDNSFPVLTTPPVTDYSAGDQRDSGAPIFGVSDGLGGVLPTPAAVSVGSYAALATGTGSASAVGDNTLGSSFMFTAAAPTTLSFDFDIRAYVSAFVSGDEGAGTAANASTTFSFVLTNLTTGVPVLSATPFALNAPIVQVVAPNIGGLDRELNWVHTAGTATNVCFNQFVVACAGGGAYAGSIVSAPLVVGDIYQLDAIEATGVNIARIPEPGTALLLGLGMLGLGAARRRKLSS